MKVPFYRAFEDRHRGSRDLIRQRLQVYLPFIDALKQMYGKGLALDLGCGRGEWLELLADNGCDARGIDIDEGMLEGCRTSGLSVGLADAVEALKAMPDESLTAITAFHLAEHLPFEVLQELVSESLRALKPAGLLILETPNAENLVVGSSSFYLDPTHQRPIPHPLLEFLVEYAGFHRSKLLRLQEFPELREAEHLDLLSVLQGASPDYAVVAQKFAGAEQLALFNESFSKAYGLSLQAVAGRFEAGLDSRFAGALGGVQAVSSRVDELGACMQSLVARMDELEKKYAEDRIRQLEEVLEQAKVQQSRTEESLKQSMFEAGERERLLSDLRWQLGTAMEAAARWEVRAESMQARAEELEASTSWRITRPMRIVSTLVRRVGRSLRRLVRSSLGMVLRLTMTVGNATPGAKKIVRPLLVRHPHLYAHLKAFWRNKTAPRLRSSPTHQATMARFTGGQGLSVAQRASIRAELNGGGIERDEMSELMDFSLSAIHDVRELIASGRPAR